MNNMYQIDSLPLVAVEPHEFQYTYWPSRTAVRDGTTRVGFDKLVKDLQHWSSTVEHKANLPLLGLYTTQDGRRSGDSLDRTYALCFDCDAGESPERMIDFLAAQDVTHVVYDTWSNQYTDTTNSNHNPHAKSCWRLVLPLSEPLRRGDLGEKFLAYKTTYHAIGGYLWRSCGLDLETWDARTDNPALAWHPGARPNGSIEPRRAYFHKGLFLNAKKIVASIPAEFRTSRCTSTVVCGTPASESRLNNERMEALARELAPAWKEIGGRHVRHDAAMALARVLVRRGCGIADVVPVVHRMAVLAEDRDEIDFGDRSRTAGDALESGDRGGYGYPFLRDEAPELLKAIDGCNILEAPLPRDLADDLDGNQEWDPESIEKVRCDLYATLIDLKPGDVTGLRYPPGAAKTTAACGGAVERAKRGLRTAILAKTYRLVWELDDLLAKAGVPVRVLLTPTAKNYDGDTICGVYDQVHALSAAGLDARRAICKSCPCGADKDSCGAFAGAIGEPDACVILGVHGVMGGALEGVGPEGLLIVDEAIDLYQDVSLTLGDLTAARSAADRVVVNAGQRLDIRNAVGAVKEWAAHAPDGEKKSFHELMKPMRAIAFSLIKPWQLELKASADGDFVRQSAALGKVLTPLYGAASLNKVWLSADSGEFNGERGLVVHGQNPRYAPHLADHKGPIAFLDASLNADLLAAALPGRQVKVLSKQIDDSCEVDRVLICWANGVRANLMRDQIHGRKRTKAIRWDMAVGPVREVFALIDEFRGFEDPTHVRVLFASFKQFVDPLRDWLGGTAEVEDDPSAAEVVKILKDFIDRGNTIRFEHYGDGLGTNEYSDFDCVVTFGDPWINKGVALREARFTDEDHRTAYRRRVRQEKAQMFGRLRTILPERKKTALMIDVGQVAPLEWTDEIVEVRKLKTGRPTACSASGRVRPTKADRMTLGMTQAEYARHLGVSVRTVKRMEERPGLKGDKTTI